MLKAKYSLSATYLTQFFLQTVMSTSSQFQDILRSDANFQASNLRVGDAQAIIKKFVAPIQDTETVGLFDALNRILAHDIISPIHVPAHDNSAMDGYAFSSAQLQGEKVRLSIAGSALAGHPYTGSINTDDCVRIMTGAVMPEGCDTVIPQELCEQISEQEIHFSTHGIHQGDNRRLQGEDLHLGHIALAAGKRIGAADLGLLASLGIAQVNVYRRLKIASFSTGDEIRSLGETLDSGCIYDSNRYTVFGMLSALGCEILDLGVIADHPDALEAALRQACVQADAIITSGGVSVGAADYTRQVMAKMGEVEFWTIAMRPGRPLAFGEIRADGHSAYLFGLPGNPVAVMVSFYFFVQQALQRMMGAQITPPLSIPAISMEKIKKRPGRTEYQRGIASRSLDGRLQVKVTGSQGSGILRSMSEANCMIILNDESGDIAAGDTVELVLFQGLI